MSAAASKETIYIDIDDEITSIIDKVQSSDKNIVALVLPKRAAVLQSVVNMKLLKRAGDSARKRIVLITSETNILPLAGVVGMYVAKTLNSKPTIPPKPTELTDTSSGGASGEDTSNLDPNKPVGELADSQNDSEEPIEIDNLQSDDAQSDATDNTLKNEKKNKFKIPNFDRFRTRLIIGGAVLLLLIFGWYWAFFIAPRAVITVLTDTTSNTVDLDFTTDPGINEVDEVDFIVPASVKEFKQTDSKTVAASGEKDVGTKASGTVTLTTECSASTPNVPSGTAVSTGNLTYITQESVSIDDVNVSGGRCTFSTEVSVEAQNPGEDYNIRADRDFNVAGFPGVSGVNETSMSGGTTRLVAIVSQSDIDDARNDIANSAPEEVRERMIAELDQEGYIGIFETFSTGETVATANPNVGEEADEVTVNVTVTYEMIGVERDGLKKLIENDAIQQIDTEKQMIVDDGMNSVVFRLNSKDENGRAELNVQTIVVAGPNLDEDAVKAEAAGKNRGEATRAIEGRPGIREVEIAFSHFWVYDTPKDLNKISVEFLSENIDQEENADEE
jgi:hypothetical protein